MNLHQLPQPRLGPYPEHPRHCIGNRPPHTPLRPTWACRACCQPWPCAEAQLLLRVEFEGRRSGLLIYLAGLLYEAMHDLYHLSPDDQVEPHELFDRFVSWA